MNRERILFVAVLAILALWFFVIRSKDKVIEDVKPGTLKIERIAVKSSGLPDRPVVIPDPAPFTLVTNERPHKRPMLPPTEARDLPNIWPPTSRSVSLKFLGKLRRAAIPSKADDTASVTLPELIAGGDGDAAGPAQDRVDQWQSFGRNNQGLVIGIRAKGRMVRPPNAFPEPGNLPEFYKLLLWLEIDPDKAAQAGVTGVEVRFSKGGSTVQAFPAEIAQFRIAAEGKRKGWFEGAKAYLKLPAKGFDRRKNVGARLLSTGRKPQNNQILGWALYVLNEARGMISGAAQNQLRDTLLLELEAANLLNKQETVLGLGFHHLSQFPKETAVLEYMGNILSSRSYGLDALAARFLERAANSKSAQRSRAALLIRMGEFAEAGELLDGGAAGGGTLVDLLRARVALAQADYKTAVERAEPHANGTGPDASEAHQILGGVAYAQGDASTAERHFMEAVNADNRRSTAYSDLGLAFAVQGKAADAQVCFKRAMDLDFENSVIPRLGGSFLKLTLAESLREDDTEEVAAPKRAAREASVAELNKLQSDNPRNLLVRYYVAYAKEKSGDGEGAAVDLRAILDEDHRYRIAIARLGIVQASRREGGGSDALVRPAVAHLTKAAELNPEDATVAYILGRFLMSQDLNRQDADRFLARAQSLNAPAGDDNLPLWAEAARAALKYRDESIEERRVRAAFSSVLQKVKQQGQDKGIPDIEKYAAGHPVGAYASKCRDIVQENATKVDVVWEFGTKPRDWTFKAISPMQVIVTRDKGVHFLGDVDFQGKEVDHNTRLEHCVISYVKDKRLIGNSFFELIVEGEIGEANNDVSLGVGIVGPGARRRLGRTGIQIKRSARGTAEVRLEGGETEIFKRDKARNYLEFPDAKWPKGKFKIHFKVDDREQGKASIWLNGENVLATKLKERDGSPRGNERCTIFGRGRGNRQIHIFVWIEGTEGAKFRDIYIRKVTLVRAGQ